MRKGLPFLVILLVITVSVLSGCTNNSLAKGTTGQVQSITVQNLKKQLAAGLSKHTVIVDLREPDLYNQGHIPGAILIGFADFEKKYTQLDKNSTIILVCHMGSMGEAAGQFLISKGYSHVYNLTGGMRAWDAQS